MGHQKSIVRHYLRWSLFAGILMGAVFPVFSLLFVEKFKSLTAFVVFSLSCVMAGVFVGVISFLIGKSTVINFIKKVSIQLQEISRGNGDLTKRLDIKSDDEIGNMTHHFNDFVEKLQGILNQVADNSMVVASAAHDLSVASTQIAAGAEEMSTQTTDVSFSTSRVSEKVKAMSTLASEMSISADVTKNTFMDISSSLKNISEDCKREAEIAEDATIHARKSQEIMECLGVSSRSIGSVVEIIDSITAKTNLLALNATMEAARSGAAGKGFGVVAREVKELARLTAEATNEIRKEITEIQRNTSVAIVSIEHVNGVITEVNNVSKNLVNSIVNQCRVFDSVTMNIREFDEGAKRVTLNVSESSDVLTDISSTIHGVESAVKDTTQSIVLVKNHASELAKLSENLNGLLSQFKVR